MIINSLYFFKFENNEFKEISANEWIKWQGLSYRVVYNDNAQDKLYHIYDDGVKYETVKFKSPEEFLKYCQLLAFT